MDKNKRNILIGVSVIVIAIIVWGIMKQGGGLENIGGKLGGSKTGTNIATSADVFRPDNPEALPTVQGGTREEVKTEIKTPEPGASSSVSADVAVPKSATVVSGESGSAAIRSFEIKLEGGNFTPSTIVVNELDIMQIDVTGVDKDYAITFPDFGIFREVKKGEQKKIQFQAYPFGEYKFNCKDCAGEGGKLIVNKK